eukprot:scaffold48_cov311-Pinguiococcus_pyrenoidosus.AAC.8
MKGLLKQAYPAATPPSSTPIGESATGISTRQLASRQGPDSYATSYLQRCSPREASPALPGTDRRRPARGALPSSGRCARLAWCWRP